MARIKSLLFLFPLLSCWAIAAPAQADCARHKVWDRDHDSYVWKRVCYRDRDDYPPVRDRDDWQSFHHDRDDYPPVRDRDDWQNQPVRDRDD
jgi:hypothetical protein